MNWNKWDWKFFVTLFATIAGVVVPVYLWQADFTSKALGLRLLSTSALQPAADIQDLQIFINGKKIGSPYLSSFELINTGSKPVLSAEFESPIEIFPKDGAKIVSAQITTTDPQNIPVKIAFDEQRVLIAPFLSNPKDAIAFSIITSGAPPSFEPRARVAGIKSITFEDSTSKKGEYRATSFNLFLGFALLIPYLLFLIWSVTGVVLPLSRLLAFFISTACYAGLVKAFTDAYAIFEPWPSSTAILIAITISALGLSIFVIKKTMRYAFRARRNKSMRPHEPFAAPPWK